VVRADAGAIEEGHAERDAAALHEFQQALPDALLRPTDEQLRGQPPRAKLGRDAAPLGAVLMAPEDRRDRPPQVLRRRLPVRPNLFDQRFPDDPGRVRKIEMP